MTVRFFAVESWGCAGTHWLARVLDSHPDICCFHAINGAFANTTGTERLRGMDYIDLLREVRLGHPVVGDVHGFDRASIPDVRAALGDRFRSVVLVRDPIPRFRSLRALHRHGEWRRWAKKGRLWNIDYVKPVARAAGIRLSNDYEQMLVVHAACMLNVILEEQAIGPIFRMEDLVESPDALRSLVTTLSAGTVEASSAWLEWAIGQPPLTRHARGEDLTPYELDALERVVKPEAWEAYRRLGYACELPQAVRAGSS